MLENRVLIKEGLGASCPLGSKCKVSGYHLGPQHVEALRRYGVANFQSSPEAASSRSLDADHLSDIDSDRFHLFTTSPVCVCCWDHISKSKSDTSVTMDVNTDIEFEDSDKGSIGLLHSFDNEQTCDTSIPIIPKMMSSDDTSTVRLSCSHTFHRKCLLSAVRNQTHQYLRCPYSPVCAALLVDTDLSSLSDVRCETSIDEFESLLTRVCKSVSTLEDATDAFINATTKACPNQACRLRVTHYHGHACHHIMPTPFCYACQSYSCSHGKKGCPGCGLHFCYRCEQNEVLLNFHI